MADFIKYLIIDSVDEDSDPGKYLKREQIVDVRDSEGNPWEPVPGPDPWDELVVSSATRWSNLNNYAVGEEIYGSPASFIGGSDQVTYRYRWQTKANSADSWTNSGWTTYTGSPEVFTTATAGYVRLHAQARDTVDPENVVQVNSFGPQEHILNVGSVQVTGNRMAGETIECSAPTASGGAMPYTTTYTWSNGATGKTYLVQVADVGNELTCTAKVVDADGNNKEVTSNALGPIVQYTIGTVTAQIDGVAYDPENDVQQVTQHSTSILTVSASGNSPNINYTWSVRQGEARITPSGAMCTVVHQSNPPNGEAVHVDVVDNYASDDNKAVRFSFLVQ